jgi:hypothetical protein
MRPNRFQTHECRRILNGALGETRAQAIAQASGIDAIPALLDSGPRDLDALARELQPFVDVYRALLDAVPREQALALIRQCIIASGTVSHSADAVAGPADSAGQPLNLTSPPLPGFSLPAAELRRRFDIAMAQFSCEGELVEYAPERVRFFVTQCNWCEAMRRAGAPELIAFFCETDERFMDDHPTHRLVRPTAIGAGGERCDFQFVRRAE